MVVGVCEKNRGEIRRADRGRPEGEEERRDVGTPGE